MKEKKILLAIIAIAVLLILGANSVLATSSNLIVIQGNGTTDTNTVDNTTDTNTANTQNILGTTNTANTTNTTNTTNNTSVVSSSVYNNTTTLPKTGANDYAVFAIIAVCVICAVYAYKKIREYNI